MGNGRFVADVHLAKLAKYLRLLGFDTLYFNQIDDDALIKIAQEQERTILTKDRELCRRSKRCYIVRNKEIKKQLKEVLEHFGLEVRQPFSRCMVDNTELERVNKEEIKKKLPPKVNEWCNQFWRCTECGRIYWHGSHYERMKEFIQDLGVQTP